MLQTKKSNLRTSCDDDGGAGDDDGGAGDELRQ